MLRIKPNNIIAVFFSFFPRFYSIMQFKDSCEIGFRLQFNAKFPRQVMNFPMKLCFFFVLCTRWIWFHLGCSRSHVGLHAKKFVALKLSLSSRGLVTNFDEHHNPFRMRVRLSGLLSIREKTCLLDETWSFIYCHLLRKGVFSRVLGSLFSRHLRISWMEEFTLLPSHCGAERGLCFGSSKCGVG